MIDALPSIFPSSRSPFVIIIGLSRIRKRIYSIHTCLAKFPSSHKRKISLNFSLYKWWYLNISIYETHRGHGVSQAWPLSGSSSLVLHYFETTTKKLDRDSEDQGIRAAAEVRTPTCWTSWRTPTPRSPSFQQVSLMSASWSLASLLVFYVLVTMSHQPSVPARRATWEILACEDRDGEAISLVLLVIRIHAMPESPRWLVMQGRLDEANGILAKTYDSKKEAELLLSDIKEPYLDVCHCSHLITMIW